MCRKLYDKLYEITGAKLDFNDKNQAFILLEEQIPVCITDNDEYIFLTGLLNEHELFTENIINPEHILILNSLSRDYGSSICLLPDTHQCVLTKKHYKKYLSPDELIESLYEFLFCIKLTIANITSEVN